VTQVVAIQPVTEFAYRDQPFFHLNSNCGLSGTGQAGQPENDAFLAKQMFTLAAINMSI